MRRIIAIQHTESMQHVNGMVGSWQDWDLTERLAWNRQNEWANALRRKPAIKNM